MLHNRGIQQYKIANTKSSSSEKLIVMIYDHLVISLQKAKEAILADDLVLRNQSINKAQSIITELRNNLDHDIDNALTSNLDSIYSYMFNQNLQALITNDSKHIDQILITIEPIHNAWRGISSKESHANDKAGSENATNIETVKNS